MANISKGIKRALPTKMCL